MATEGQQQHVVWFGQLQHNVQLPFDIPFGRPILVVLGLVMQQIDVVLPKA